jgi:hypothetical protein
MSSAAFTAVCASPSILKYMSIVYNSKVLYVGKGDPKDKY